LQDSGGSCISLKLIVPRCKFERMSGKSGRGPRRASKLVRSRPVTLVLPLILPAFLSVDPQKQDAQYHITRQPSTRNAPLPTALRSPSFNFHGRFKHLDELLQPSPAAAVLPSRSGASAIGSQTDRDRARESDEGKDQFASNLQSTARDASRGRVLQITPEIAKKRRPMGERTNIATQTSPSILRRPSSSAPTLTRASANLRSTGDDPYIPNKANAQSESSTPDRARLPFLAKSVRFSPNAVPVPPDSKPPDLPTTIPNLSVPAPAQSLLQRFSTLHLPTAHFRLRHDSVLTILPPSLPGSEGDVVLQMDKNIKHGKSSSNADGEGEEEGSLIYRFSGDGEKVIPRQLQLVLLH